MPVPKPCAIPGCPEDALPGRSRCADHQRRARQRSDANRPTAARRGYDAKWNRTRGKTLARRPHCECDGCPSCRRLSPTGRCLRPAVDVDHLDGLGPLGPRGHDDDNLQPLCHQCHAHRTGRDQSWMTA